MSGEKEYSSAGTIDLIQFNGLISGIIKFSSAQPPLAFIKNTGFCAIIASANVDQPNFVTTASQAAT